MTAELEQEAPRDRDTAPRGVLLGFKQHLRPVIVPGEGVFLFSDDGVTAVQGPHVEVLAHLLDGSHDIPGLLQEAARKMPVEQAQQALAELVEAGLVTTRDSAGEPAHESAFWDLAGLDNVQAASSVRSATVRLIGIGPVDLTEVQSACESSGLTVQRGSTAQPPTPGTPYVIGSVSLTIVVCDDYLNPELAALNAALRARHEPWLLTRPHGPQLWVGPIFRPDDGACWSCLSYRLWGNRASEALVQAKLGQPGRPAARSSTSLAALTTMGANMVALEAVKWLAGHRHDGQHSIWTLNGLDLASRSHQVVRRPECADCGEPDLIRERAWQPVLLTSRPVVSRGGGGSRAVAPEQVLEQHRHLIGPITGVVSEIRRDDRGPSFLNSYRAGTNAAAGATELAALRGGLRCENGGKGVTPLLGKVSALCESLERHSGQFRGDEARLRATMSNLGDKAIHPDECQLFDPRQLPDRRSWNASHAPFQRVCEPFDPEIELDWTPVWSMTEQQHRLLPTAMLYYGAPGPASVRADSNGSAAGSSLEDAVLQGALELIERDAVSLWWYNRTRHPAVSLEAFGNDWIEQMLEGYATMSREVWVLDITADLEVPTMVALSRRLDKPAEDVIFGFGADLDPRVALRRALTELNQLVPSLVDVPTTDEIPNSDGVPMTGDLPTTGGLPMTDENEYGCADPDAVGWWRHATIQNQPYLRPDPSLPARTPADYCYRPSEDLLGDVLELQRRFEGRGLNLLVLNQTRADIGLPVVKVIVPGMRTFWSRWAPGRLFDVPVELGRLAVATRYEDLNPIPMFL